MTDAKDVIIYLDPPIKFADKVVSEFVVREPTTGAVDRAFAYIDNTSQGMVRYYCSLIRDVSGLSKALVELLPYTKYREAVAAIENFMSVGPQTGETSDTT